jgi:hypothetical protein
MLALGASLVLRAAAYSLTEAGEPYNVIAPPKVLANATTHSRVDCGAFLEEAECRKKQALQRKAKEGVDLVQILQDAFKKEVGTDTGKGELKAKAKRRRLKKKKKMLAAKKRKARKVKAMIKKVKAQRASSDNATQAVADAPKVAGAIYNETRPQQQQQEQPQPQQGEDTDESKMTVAQKAKKEKEKAQTAQKEARQKAREQRKRLHTPGQDWNSTTSTSCWSMDSQASGEWCNSNCQAGGESSECASWCCCQVACNGWTEKSMPPSMKGAQNMTLPEPEFQGVPWGEKKARRAQKRLSQRRKKKAGKEGEAAGKGEEKNQEETKPNRKGKRKDRNAAKRVHFD